MTHLALFLGAGSSKPFGYPLTRDVLPRVLARASRAKLFKANVDKCSALLESIGRLFPGISLAEPEQSALPQITDVLSLLDRLVLDGYDLGHEFPRARILETRRLLELGVAELLERSSDVVSLKPSKVEEWVRALQREAGPEGRVSVLTTNYDLVLEQGLYRVLGDESGELSLEELSQRVDFGFDWRLPNYHDHEPVVSRPRGAAIGLYKLHGSLNWLRCDQCGYVYVNHHGAIYGLEHLDSPSDHNTCTCGARLRAVLVTPSTVRDVRDANLLTVWNSALEALRTADRWSFVGYSLPGEDVSLRSILLRARCGWQHRGDPKRKLDVHAYLFKDDPSVRTPEQARYEAFFPEITIHAGGVEEHLADLGVSVP